MSELLRQAQLAEDRSLIARCAAAAARAGVDQPSEWTQRNAWKLAITPGWGSVRVEADISDAEVVAAVARLLDELEPESEADPDPEHGHEAEPDPPDRPETDGDTPVTDTESPA